MNLDDFDLYDAKEDEASTQRVRLLDPDLVYPDPKNVRREIDPEGIKELASTIKQRGQLQPITVAPQDADGRYCIMFGERRWRACMQIGVKVRAVVSTTYDPKKVRIDQVIENDQRDNLTAADMVAFVGEQVAEGTAIADLARQIGRSRPVVSRYHALAVAPDYVQALLDKVPTRGAVMLAQAAKLDEQATRAFVAANRPESISLEACAKFVESLEARPHTSIADSGESERTAEAPQTLVVTTPAAQAGDRTDDQDKGEQQQAVAAPAPSEPTPVKTSPSKGPAEKQSLAERPKMEIEGQQVTVIEALVHFPNEDRPRLVSWR